MMSVFDQFCQAWGMKFPGEDLPGIWQEDVRANLAKHQAKLELLKLEVKKEEFYCQYLESVLSDVEKAKLRSQSLAESVEEASTSGSISTDSSTDAEKPDFVTVISITNQLEEDEKCPAKFPERPKAPPKPPPKQYFKSSSVDSSSKSEDLVAWTKQQIQQLQSKQSMKNVDTDIKKSPIKGYENVELRKTSANYENISAASRRLDYENVFHTSPRKESCSSEESPTQAQQRPVSDFDSETGRVRRATALYQQKRTISAPVGSFPALSLLEETVIDDPLYDMVPHEDPGNYMNVYLSEDDDKDDVEKEGNGTLKSFSSTDNSSMGSLNRLYANVTSLDDDCPRSLSAKQKLILQSFLESEEVYVDALSVVLQYSKALNAALQSSQPVLTQEEINCIFFRIPQLHRHHHEFLAQIKSADNGEHNMVQIAQCLRGLSENVLPEYAVYLNNVNKALDMTQKAAQNSPQFAQLARRIKFRTKDCQQQQQTTTLEELLHKPVNRLQRLVTVIQDLLCCISQEDASYVLFQEAQQLTKTFLSEFSNHQLQSLFPTQSKKHQNPQANRHLVKNGFLVELQQDGKRKQRHCFLFTDLLVCSKYKSASGTAQLEVKWYLPLAKVFTLIDDSTSRLNASAFTNVASLRSQAAAARTQLERSTAGLEKHRKKLASLEAKLLLDSPNLPLKFLFKPKGSNSKASHQYTFLLSSEFERTLWLEAVETLKRNIGQPVQLQWEEVENLVKACRTAIEPPVGLGKSSSAVALSGELQIVIHSLLGLLKPTDVYLVVELDSYGHYFHKARTKMAVQSREPRWEEDFHIELEGSRGLRILLYEQDSQQVPVLRGKVELELTIAWLKGLTGPQLIPLSNQLSRSLLSRNSVAEELNLCLTIRYISHDLTLRRPLQRSAATGIFGVPIEEVCQREKRPIPYIISCCVREIERRGLEELGIYRVSGLATDIAKLRKAFDTRGAESDLLFRDVDVNSVSGLLKLYLRQLPEALFTDKLYPHFLQAFSTLDVSACMSGVEEPSVQGGTRSLVQLFSSLPKVNQNVIVYLLDHLVRVNSKESQNKMSLHNLATVFGPTLLRPANLPTASDSNDLLALGTVDVMAQAGILYFFLLRKARRIPIQYPS